MRDPVIIAESWLGTPYIHQAAKKGIGCDCLGLIRGIYSEFYNVPLIVPPPYNPGWGEHTGNETLYAGAKEYMIEDDSLTFKRGHVILFRHKPELIMKHCGIVVDDQRMIHSIQKQGVCYTHYANSWKRKAITSFHFKDEL